MNTANKILDELYFITATVVEEYLYSSAVNYAGGKRLIDVIVAD